MSGRRVLAVALRLLSQFRRDRRTLMLLFAVPLVVLGLIDALLRGGASRPAMGVVNLDQGPLGTAVASQLESSAVVDAAAMDAGNAEARLRDGSLAGYVVLPAGLSASAAAGGTVAPEVHLEGGEPSSAAAVQQATGQALAGVVVARLVATGLPVPRVAPVVTYRYGGPALDTLDSFGGAFVGLVVFFLVFVVTCVAFLRERSQGTLERLMASPLRRGEVVAGYAVAFTVLALLQSAEVLVFALAVLHIHNAGSVALVFGMEVLLAFAAVNLGIFLSTFARTEFQAVQFIPIVIVPQLLLSGVLLPVASEPGWLQAISNVLPLTYAAAGLRDVMLKGADLTWASVQVDGAVVLGFGLAALAAATATLRRQVA